MDTQKKVFGSLKMKLNLTIIAFAMIPVLLLSVLFIRQFRANLILDQESTIDKQLQLLNDNIDTFFDSMLDNVSYFAESSLLKQADDTLASYYASSKPTLMTPGKNGGIEARIFERFTEFGKTHPSYQYVYMGTEQGGYIQYPDGEISAGFDPRQRPWYPNAIAAGGKPVIGSPYYYDIDDIVILGISQAIVNDGGETVGVMALDSSVSTLTGLFERSSEAHKGYFMLIDKDGTIIADPSNQENNFVNVSEAYSADFNSVIGQAGFQQVTLNGEKQFVKAKVSERTGWKYVAVMPESEVLAVINKMTLLVIVAALLLMLLSTIVGTVTSGKIANPVNQVTKAARQVVDGNFDVSLSTKASGEVGQLIDAFNRIGVTLKSYQSYIVEITEALDEISRGNLCFQLQQAYTGEFGRIKDALLNISTSLTQTLSQISSASNEVASGSGQVAHSAQALSQGATQQASSVQELAATINEISSQVANNSRLAREASGKVSQVGQEMAASNEQMQHMITAMNEISDSSGEIGKIIKTIEDIAFQTNILALNAAVEAARAGAAGKGFAVVADEVRNLAGKSAEASKNTAELIAHSVSAVENGVGIANSTAQALRGAVKGAEEAAEMVNLISGASEEQTKSIAQVTIGVDQISSVVQTNSATAEESAAASEELSGQAQMLKELVGRFTLKTEDSNGTLSALPGPYETEHR